MSGIIIIFVTNDKKLLWCMAQISKHVNSSNHKIYSCDQMRKMVVNFGSKKWKKSICQLSCLQNSLLMVILDTPEKDVSNVNIKSDMIQVRTSVVK